MKKMNLTYKNEVIGTFKEIGIATFQESYEGSSSLVTVTVDSDSCMHNIEQALLDAYTDTEWCGHDFDCCGCVRSTAWSAIKVTSYEYSEEVWVINGSSCRNV